MVYQLESPDINTVINYCKDLCANDNMLIVWLIGLTLQKNGSIF